MVYGDSLGIAGASNTPAQNTDEKRQTLCVDWVTASFFSANELQTIFNYFGIEDLENLDTKTGARFEFAGYDLTHKLGAIEVLQDTKNNKWMLNLTGQGCREYELRSGYDFVTLFGLLACLNASYTRLDIAVDDFDDIYNVNIIRNAVYNKQCVTKLKEWGNSQRGLIDNGFDGLTMDSFYLGSKNSRYFINVYNKKMERADKGLDVDVKTWTRTEVRLKDEYAEQFVMFILQDSRTLGDNLFAFLNEKITFLSPAALSKDKNKSRLAKDINNYARWWRKFLNTTQKLKLTVYKPDLTLLHSRTWLFRQVSTTLAMLDIYYEGSNDFDLMLGELIATGREKMEKKHVQRINQQKDLDAMMGDLTTDDLREWHKRDVIPRVKRLEELKTNSNKYKEAIQDIYWNQVGNQNADMERSKETNNLSPVDFMNVSFKPNENKKSTDDGLSPMDFMQNTN